MGNLTSIVTGLNSLTRVVGAFNNVVGAVGDLTGNPEEERRRNLRAQQDLALRQLRRQQSLDTRNRAEEAGLERERLAADAEAADKERRAALRRAVARQRSRFGSQGIGTTDGSAEAVLLGLFEESDDDSAERERLDELRNRAIGQDFVARNRINMLQRSQLQERQRLERLVEGI